MPFSPALLSNRFLVVYDEAFRDDAAALAAGHAFDLMDVESFAEAQVAGVPNLLFAVDLRDQGVVALLRRAVGNLHGGGVRAFMVESGQRTHAWRVQADALGATCHVLRAASPEARRELAANLERAALSLRSRSLSEAPGGASIETAGAALSRLAEGFSAGAPVSLASVADTGTEVLREVASLGADRWLETVRDYHVGTFQHCLLVAGTAAAYARTAAMDTRSADRLVHAAVLHDIGKTDVPVAILDKPGRLTDSEFALVRNHPIAGHAYLAAQAEVDPLVLDAVLHHHELLDGSGYPHGLRGGQIAPLTRVLTVCDVFAALVESRAYKRPRPPQEAIAMLVGMAIAGRVDYAIVRRLALAFGMQPPQTLAQVLENLSPGPPAAVAS